MKYAVTIVEQAIHIFSVDVEPGEDPYEAAKEAFEAANAVQDLEHYRLVIKNTDVDHVAPV